MSFSRANPSARYTELLEQYRQVHQYGIPDQNIEAEDAFSGKSLNNHIKQIGEMSNRLKAETVLDYGSGKASQYAVKDILLPDGHTIPSIKEYWGNVTISCFDPGFAKHSTLPDGKFDGVVCTDVLEHVPQEDVSWVLAEIFGYANRFVFANVACYPAQKVLPNGENAHCTVQSPQWWREKVAVALDTSGFAGEFRFLVKEKLEKPSLMQRLVRKGRFAEHVMTHETV